MDLKPAQERGLSEKGARSMVVVGAVLMSLSAILAIGGGVALYQADQAVQAAHERAVAMDKSCMPQGSFACGFHFDFSFLEGLSGEIAGMTLFAFSASHFITGVTLLAVGEHRLHRRVELRPAPFAPLPLRGSAAPSPPSAPALGTSLQLSF